MVIYNDSIAWGFFFGGHFISNEVKDLTITHLQNTIKYFETFKGIIYIYIYITKIFLNKIKWKYIFILNWKYSINVLFYYLSCDKNSKFLGPGFD
jgi:hypothetical protein